MKRSGLFFLLSAIGMLPASAGLIIVGQPPDSGTGNCFPFGCAYSGEYQQVYTESAFSGPITISGLEFFNTQFDNAATSLNTGTWTISLSTTSADWNTLSDTFASNIGADNTTVFTGNIGQAWTFGDTLSITFSTPFTYTPSSGNNLLMDVVVTGASSTGGSVYFDTNTGSILGRVYNAGVVQSGYGLETGFLTGDQSTAPEPGTLVLVSGGFVLGLLRLRRRSSSRPADRM